MDGSLTHFSEWQPVRLYAEGQFPAVGRHWTCSPAWNVTALFREPDAELPHPDTARAAAGGAGPFPGAGKKKYIFTDRHIDRRFHIEYRLTTRDRPRTQTPTVPDPDRSWDTLIAHRDRYLADAGLTLESLPQDIARCLADSFKHDAYFKHKPLCTTYASEQRALTHPIDGLLHLSHCVGCATAFSALAESCGLPARCIGCGAHWVAEVRIGKRWHFVENTCRHEKNRGLDAFFQSSFMDMNVDPLGEHGGDLLDEYRNGLWRRPNGQYHFTGGTWQSLPTLRFAASNAYALYPDAAHWHIKSEDGRRMPIVLQAGGFYYSGLHNTLSAPITQIRRTACPLNRHAANGTIVRDYLYHPFRPGDRLRLSTWLEDTDDMDDLEVTFTFGPSQASDFSPAVGRQLIVRLGDFTASLADLGAWPPTDPGTGEPCTCTVTIPTDALRAHAVNWIELQQNSAALFHAAFVPAAMQPAEAPLWTETGDRVNPSPGQ